MKNALLFILCGITIAITEQYESNSTLLEHKVTSEKILDQMLYMFGNLLASIEIDKKHVCTGFPYKMPSRLIVTTAKCAQRLTAFLSHDLPEKPSMRICAWDLTTDEQCSGITDIGINKIFYQHEENEDFTPENSALLKIHSTFIGNGEERKPDANISLEPGKEVTVLAHRFPEPDSHYDFTLKTYADAIVLGHEECASIFGVDLDKTPIFRSGTCIRLCRDEVIFQEGDEGSPVFYRWKWIGIVAQFTCDIKTAYVVRPRTFTNSDYMWIPIEVDPLRG